jgi:predicted short-subunit dehydrogenase-like oxidoreductase (DUF2520 family)
VEAVSSLAALLPSRPDLLILAVPDDAVTQVAAELGALLQADPAPWSPVVLHTSGTTSVSALAPCRKAGSATLVFHPLQTFPDPVAGAHRFPGTAIAITPASGRRRADATAFGWTLAERLGSRPFLLDDAKRALYHAAAAMACNYLVTLEDRAKRLFVEAGLPEDGSVSLFLPLVRSTVDNIASAGTAAALTGPLSRGDVGTVEDHLAALERYAPDMLALYVSLGLATLDLVSAQGRVDAKQIAGLRCLLESHGPSLSTHPHE